MSVKVTSQTTYLCMTYDSISIFKHSINHLLMLGEDYDDPEILIKSMRLQRLTGCMGDIFFLTDSNSVATFKLGLGQLKYNISTSSLYISFFATSNKYNTQIIEYSQRIEWPDELDTAPLNYIDFGTCGIDERLIRPSKIGKNIFIILSAIFFTASLFSAWLSTKVFKYSITHIEKDKSPSLSDYWTLFYMIIQLFQILALGQSRLFKFSGLTVHKLLGMNWISLYNYDFLHFWKLMNFYIYLIYLYILFVLVTIKTESKIFESFYLIGKLKDFIDVLIPIIGHFLFIPLISNLMNIFNCFNAVGDDIEDSYLESDCKVFCYQGMHLLYSYFVGIGLLFYITFSIFYRPCWDRMQVCLNIRTKTVYYSIQSIFQVSVVLVNAGAPVEFGDFEGFAVAFLVSVFLILTISIKPYNYERGYILQKICLILLLWCIFIDSIFQFIQEKVALVSIFFFGNLVIVIIGGCILIKAEDSFTLSQNSDFGKIFRAYLFNGRIEHQDGIKYLDQEEDDTAISALKRGNPKNSFESQNLK